MPDRETVENDHIRAVIGVFRLNILGHIQLILRPPVWGS